MTALGQKQKSSVGLRMSGVGGKAEVDFGRLEVNMPWSVQMTPWSD